MATSSDLFKLKMRFKVDRVVKSTNLFMNEDSAVNDTIGTLSVAGTSGYTFTLSENPDGKVSISGNLLKLAATLDYETAQFHNFQITATRSGKTPVITDFALSVGDVSEGVNTVIPNDDDPLIDIGWNLEGNVTIGQFQNGDYWCLPCTVLSTTYPWDGVKHGSMINPDPAATTQGYDTRVGGANSGFQYSEAKRVSFPLALTAGQSLVTTRGRATKATGGAAQVLQGARVLTCLASAPPAGTFRPPYAGTAKPLWNLSDINYSLLPNLAPPTTPYSINQVIRSDPGGDKRYGGFTRVILDHGPKVIGATCHPDANARSYGWQKTISNLFWLAASNTVDRNTAVHQLLQIGIDFYHIHLTNGDAWRGYGGFNSCQKGPILLAGVLFEDAAMKAPTYFVDNGGYDKYNKFAEDGFTYIGVSRALWGLDCLMNGINYLPYADDSNHTCRDQAGLEQDKQLVPPGGGYSKCCTSRYWASEAFMFRMMGEQALWGHDPFFEYVDEWLVTPLWWGGTNAEDYAYGGIGNGVGDTFATSMWNTYIP